MGISSLKFCFIRAGSIPENEQSKNHITGELEKGVSVYLAIKMGGKSHYRIVFPTLEDDKLQKACASLSSIKEKTLYEVSGDLIGYGSEHEPLLKKVKIIKEIKHLDTEQY